MLMQYDCIIYRLKDISPTETNKTFVKTSSI